MRKMQLFVIYDARRSNALAFLLYPFLSANIGNIQFRSSLVVPKDAKKNDALLLVGWLRRKNKKPVESIIEKAKNRGLLIGYFDDTDSAEISNPEWLRIFDLWFKKQLFKDFRLYQVSRNRQRLWASGCQEERLSLGANEIKTVSEKDLNKLRLAWNILIGSYPTQRNVQRFACLIGQYFGHSFGFFFHSFLNKEQTFDKSVLGNDRAKLCQARFSANAYGKVGLQRRVFLEETQGSKLFSQGKIPAKQFNAELPKVMACLSPFGWGEICYRDAEAIRHGACLVKPDMSHLFTWPDVYAKDSTYCAVRWDGSDLLERVESLLESQKWQLDMRANAFSILKDAHLQCGSQVEKLIQDFERLIL